MNEPVQPQQPQKKGLGTGAKIAIGCVVVVLLAIVVAGVGMFWLGKKAVEVGEEMMENPAKSIAEMAIKANPDTKFISSDDETVTFETRDGEVMTMNFEDIQQGKFSITGADGETSNIAIGPGGVTGSSTDEEGEETDFAFFGGGDASNVPDQVKYPKSENLASTIASRSADKWEGMITYRTSSTMAEVVDWQTEALEECEVTRTDIGGMRTASLTCGGDTVSLMFMGSDGSLQVTATYDIKD